MMYADSLLPQLESIARRAAEPLGVEVAWVEFKREGAAWFLRVYIDREEGAIGLDDCRGVSERLSVLLDVEDPIDSTYTLEVSSPGLDRPLWRERDYVRFTGRLVRIKTRQAFSGRRNFKGRLLGVEAGSVVMEIERTRMTVPFDLIESGRLEVETVAPGGRKRS